MPIHAITRFPSETDLVRNNLCPRCRGSVIQDRDVDGQPFLQCIACGRVVAFMYSMKPLPNVGHFVGKAV